jgi:hypothetical protein
MEIPLEDISESPKEATKRKAPPVPRDKKPGANSKSFISGEPTPPKKETEDPYKDLKFIIEKFTGEVALEDVRCTIRMTIIKNFLVNCWYS